MRFLLRILLPTLVLAAPALAQTTTINGLPAATTPLNPGDVLPVWQGGATKKVPASGLLPNSGVTPGVYGDATHCASVTFGADGRATSASQSTSCPGGAPANPTATIGATAVNGVANTFMRSDAAPALPAILPALDASLLTNLTAGNLSGAVPVAKGGTGQTAAGIAALTAVGGITGTPTGSKFLRDDMSWQSPVGAGDVVGPGSAVNNNLAAFDTTTGKLIKDSGIALANVAVNGTGAVLTGDVTITVDQFNKECRLLTINASGVDITMPSAATLQANGGCLVVANPTNNTWQLIRNGSDTINGTSGNLTFPGLSVAYITTNGSNALYVGIGTTAPAIANVTGLGANVGTLLTTPSSANLASALTDETGTGAAVFAGSPTFTGTVTMSALTVSGTITTGITGTANNCLQVNSSGVVSGTGSACGGGGGGSPGGSPGAVQGNIASAFAAIPNFTFDTTSGALTAAANGAASAPGLTVSGTPQAGTASNSYPQLYVAAAGATQPTTFATGGTLVGGNAPNAFAGNLLAFYINGAASPFFVDSSGEVNAKSYEVNGNSSLSNGLGLQNTNAPAIYSAGSERMRWASTFAQINYALVDTNSNGWQLATGASSCSSGGNILPRRSDSTIGICSGASGQGGLAASGEVLRWTSAGVAMQKGYLTTMGYTFSTLPATPPTGAEAYITDASSCTPAATVAAGGGSSFCKLIWNGSAWKAISG